MEYKVGTEDIKLYGGVLKLPEKAIELHPLTKTYSVEQLALNRDQYKFLFIFPKEDLTRENLSRDSIISLLSECVDLEKIVNSQGNQSIQLPRSSLGYLGLRSNSWVRVLVDANGNLVLWNPKSFERFYHSHVPKQLSL